MIVKYKKIVKWESDGLSLIILVVVFFVINLVNLTTIIMTISHIIPTPFLFFLSISFLVYSLLVLRLIVEVFFHCREKYYVRVK